MKLIIMRHAEAESPGLGGDFERRLTATGRADAARMARLLQSTGWSISEIRTSPLVRTRETGALLAENLPDSSAQPVVESRLEPGFDLDGALDLFTEVDANAVAVWVFHAPDVQRLSAALLGLRESAFYFSPGTMLALNLPVPSAAGRGMLVWKAQPEYLRGVIS